MSDALMATLVSNTVMAALMGASGWLLASALRRPALAHTVFFLALLKLVTPSFIPLFSWPGGPTPTPAAVRSFEVARDASRQPAPILPAGAVTAGQRADEVVQPSAELPRAEGWTCDAVETAWSWPRILGWVWLAGAAVVAMLVLRRASDLRRLLREARPAGEELLEEVREARRRVALRRMPLVLTCRGDVPPLVLVGRGGATLLVSMAVATKLDRESRVALWTHELAHLRRGDAWVRWFEVAIRCVMWWHPLAWWLIRQMREAEERACDGWATATASPGERRRYCDALLLVAGSCALPDPVPASPAARPVGRRLRSWQRRLEDVMTRGSAFRSSLTARLTVVLLGAAALPVALGQDAPGPTRSLAERLDRTKISIEFEHASIDRWSARVARLAGLQVEVEDSAREVAPERSALRGFRLSDVSVRRVLDVICVLTDLSWSVDDDDVVRLTGRAPVGGASQGPRVRCHGAVRDPGIVQLADDATVLSLLAGLPLTDEADLGAVQLVRTRGSEPLTIAVDADAMMRTGNTASNFVLRDGDIVTVPRRLPVDLPPLTLRPGVEVRFVVDPALAVQPGCELLSSMTERQRVQRDGTIFVPLIGNVVVDGLTREGVNVRVRRALAEVLKIDVQIWARFD